MENTEFRVSPSLTQQGELAKTFMAKVFSWMAIALFISGAIAWLFGNSALINEVVSIDPATNRVGLTALGWIALFAPLAFILVISFGIQRMSVPVLILLFIAYSALMGVSLSTLFLRYTSASIYGTFAIAGGMFGAMAILGYTTKTDLTSFGKIMMMGLIGIIIASIVNMFIGSSAFNYFISFIGVLVFTGLTAYDVQKLKNIGSGEQYGAETTDKLAIMGALNLYLDFVNLFLFLLNLFGDRK